MDCFIGLDIGTSAVKGLLLSSDGKTLATASGEFNYRINNREHLLDPSEFLEVCFDVIKTLSKECGSYRLVAICPCCASGNLIFLDEEYKPLTQIIGWQSSIEDDEFCKYYSSEDCMQIYRKIGWPVLNGFPIAFFPYIAKNYKEILARAKMICMSAEYLNFALTDKFGISHSMGTPFYLIDQEKGSYDKALLDRFEIKESQLPPISNKGNVLGTIKPEVAEKLGVNAEIAVVLGSFDHPSCATGAGVYKNGEVLLSCGTSWVEFFPIDERAKAINTGFLVDRFMINGSEYCVMNSLISLSDKINARRNRLLGEISHSELDALITQSFRGCDGLRFDFTDSDFEKAEGYNKCHIARAIFEGAAQLLENNFEEAQIRGLHIDSITMVGGITNSEVCMQVIADTLGRDIKVINGVSAGAAGAAMLAGIGVKAYKNEEDAFSKMHFAEKIYTSNSVPTLKVV